MNLPAVAAVLLITASGPHLAVDVSAVPSTQRVGVERTLYQRCHFDWSRLPRSVSVSIGQPSTGWGVYDPATAHVTLRPAPRKRAWVLSHEMSHAVDDQLLTDFARGVIAAAWHPHGDDGHRWARGPYGAQMAEAFPAVFQRLYCPGIARANPAGAQGTDAHHPVTRAVLAAVERILGPPLRR